MTRVIRSLKIRRHRLTHMWSWVCDHCHCEALSFTWPAAMESALKHCATVRRNAPLHQSASADQGPAGKDSAS